MAEVDFDDFEDAVYAPQRDPQRAAQWGRWLNYAGAASSVALVVLLAVWGTKLVLRDVNGVPVMRALAGPMRVAPADPGGQEASNQGLSVNAIASTGIASPVPDKLTLAPMATALTADDLAGTATAVAGQAAAEPLAADANAVLAPQALPATTGADVTAPLEDGDSVAVDGAPDPTADAVSAAVSAAVAEAAGTPPQSKELTKSLVPHARPGKAVAGKSAVFSAVVEVDPATIPVGTRLAQLGAFDTPDEARAKWADLSGLYAEVMTGKSMVIQPAVAGGKSFYRLRVHGFDAEEDARRFCAVLMAGNSDCIPVAQR